MGMRGASSAKAKKRKFFSGEKNQKTFISAPLPRYQAMTAMRPLAQT
jgi:hypothetical protein